MNKIIAGATTTVLALCGFLVAGVEAAAAAPAAEVIPAATTTEAVQSFAGTCGSATIELSDYAGNPDHVVVTLDGTEVADTDFTGSFTQALTIDTSRWVSWNVEVWGSLTTDHFSYGGEFPPCTEGTYAFPERPYLPSCESYPADVALPETEGVAYDRTADFYTATATPGYLLAGRGTWKAVGSQETLNHRLDDVDFPDCEIKVNYVRAECIDGAAYIDYDTDTTLGMSFEGSVSVVFVPSEVTADTFREWWQVVYSLGMQNSSDHVLWPTWIPTDDPITGDVPYLPPTPESAALWEGKSVDLYLEMTGTNPYRKATVYIDSAIADPCAAAGTPAATPAATPVATPAATSSASPAVAAKSTDVLPATGATVGTAVGATVLLLALGTGLLWYRRARLTAKPTP